MRSSLILSYQLLSASEYTAHEGENIFRVNPEIFFFLENIFVGI